jgi:hypothetical protein
MDLNEEKNNNKKLLWAGIAFGSITLIVIAVIGALLLTAPKETPVDTTTSSSETQLSKENVPKITKGSLTRIADSDKALLNFTIDKTKSSYIVEYRIQDSFNEVLDEGVITDTNKVESEILLTNGDNNTTVRLRVSDEKTYSPWVTVKELTLPIEGLVEKDGENTEAEVNEAYFDTAWVQEIGGVENLKLALLAAWDATEVTTDDECMVLNEGTVTPGEIFPPMPSVVPDIYTLKYQITTSGNDDYNILYLWCVIK